MKTLRLRCVPMPWHVPQFVVIYLVKSRGIYDSKIELN